MLDTVHSLSSLPASSGQHKGRITACKRELRKRMKARNNQWQRLYMEKLRLTLK